MRILERIWRPNPKELSAGTVVQARYIERLTQNTAAALIQLQSAAVPSNVMRVTTLIGFQLVSGAAQIPQFLDVVQFINGSALGAGVSSEPFYVKGAATSWKGYLLLGEGIANKPGDSMLINGTWSAGAAANTLSVQLYGYDIPIGNVQ